MGDVDVPRDESVDPPALRAGPDFPWWDRSRCRTPMPWTPGPGAGFTTGRPWLRLGARRRDAERRGAAARTRTRSSPPTAGCSPSAATAPALRTGGMARLETGDPDVLAWTREAGDQRLLTVVSFVGEPRTVDLGRTTGIGALAARRRHATASRARRTPPGVSRSGPTRP